MALQINKQIGTDRGITDQAYVRIDYYTINKLLQTFDLSISMYPSEEEARSMEDQVLNTFIKARNIDFANSYSFPLDIPTLAAGDIFSIAYGLLKAKLEEVVGEHFISNC